MRMRISFKSLITGSVAVAVGVHLWGLARTDWQEFAAALTEPPFGSSARPARAAQEREAAPLPPADAAAPAIPTGAPARHAGPAAPLGGFGLEVEREMRQLLEELREAGSKAPEVPPGAAEALAREALAERVDRAAARLATEQIPAGTAAAAPASARAPAQAAAADEAALAKPRAMLENMKPADAAAIAVNMTDAQAAALLRAMDERKAAAIMAALPPERAAAITLEMAAAALPQ